MQLPHDLTRFPPCAFTLPPAQLSSKLQAISPSCYQQPSDHRPLRQTTRPSQSTSLKLPSPSQTASQFYTIISPAQRQQSHARSVGAWPSFQEIPLRLPTTQLMEKLPKSWQNRMSIYLRLQSAYYHQYLFFYSIHLLTCCQKLRHLQPPGRSRRLNPIPSNLNPRSQIRQRLSGRLDAARLCRRRR